MIFTLPKIETVKKLINPKVLKSLESPTHLTHLHLAPCDSFPGSVALYYGCVCMGFSF